MSLTVDNKWNSQPPIEAPSKKIKLANSICPLNNVPNSTTFLSNEKDGIVDPEKGCEDAIGKGGDNDEGDE